MPLEDDGFRAIVWPDYPPGVSSEQRERVDAAEQGWFQRLHARLHANPATALVTKVVVGLVGTLVIAAGVVMMVAPGPAIVVIPIGLAILALEFEWAERLLSKARAKAREAKERAAAKDPAQRRREWAVKGGLTLLVLAVVVGYVVLYDWPGFAIDGWNWAQDLTGFLPELPGM